MRSALLYRQTYREQIKIYPGGKGGTRAPEMEFKKVNIDRYLIHVLPWSAHLVQGKQSK